MLRVSGYTPTKVFTLHMESMLSSYMYSNEDVGQARPEQKERTNPRNPSSRTTSPTSCSSVVRGRLYRSVGAAREVNIALLASLLAV
jgi:hypothetical protein